MNFYFVPYTATYDFAVQSDGNASRFNTVSGQKIRDRFVDERLAVSVHPNHANLFANASASSELRGAKVTPWR